MFILFQEQIDPSLLRPGRIDVHINFPLCDYSSFKQLASNYLGLKDHKLFPQVQEIFENGASLSPAEIGELMIANRNSPSRAIKSVIGALQMDGDGRGSGKIGRLSVEENDVGSSKSPYGDGLSAVKDLRKLYGLFRAKSNVKSQSFDGGVSPKSDKS